jgi:hypothetical protein
MGKNLDRTKQLAALSGMMFKEPFLAILLSAMEDLLDEDRVQKIEADSLPLPDGAATEATLATLATESTLTAIATSTSSPPRDMDATAFYYKTLENQKEIIKLLKKITN